MKNPNHILIKRRMIAIACLVCFFIVSLISELFILTHTDHVHDHNGIGGMCAACAQIQNAENTLKLLGAVAVSSLLLLAGLYTTAVVVKIIFSITIRTLVTSKIRMNN